MLNFSNSRMRMKRIELLILSCEIKTLASCCFLLERIGGAGVARLQIFIRKIYSVVIFHSRRVQRVGKQSKWKAGERAW